MADTKGMPQGLKTTMQWVLGIGIIALILIVLLILFGNLSGNVGFTENTAGYNNTQNVIGNYSESAVNVAAQFPTVGIIIGVAILLIILIGVLVFAITRMMRVADASGSSNSSFG